MNFFFSLDKKKKRIVKIWVEWKKEEEEEISITRSFSFREPIVSLYFANCPPKIDCHLLFHGFGHYSVGIVVAVGVWHGYYGYCVRVLRSHYCHRSSIDPFELFHWWNLNNGSAVIQQSMMLHILGHLLSSAFSLDAKRCDKHDALLYSINGQRFGMCEERDRHLHQLELFDGIFSNRRLKKRKREREKRRKI